MNSCEKIRNENLEFLIKRANDIQTKFVNDFMFEDLDSMIEQYKELKELHDVMVLTAGTIGSCLDKTKSLFDRRLSDFKRFN